MLKKITTDSYAGLSTFDAPRSADVAHTALHYAIDSDDLAAAALLRQTVEKVDKQQMAATPEVALPSHSTGQHTSRFSDYNRRAINASRGGKEVLADGPTDDGEETAPLLPPFRAVSAIKQAHQTRLRPLHLAAINPNTKYLEALWDVAGDEFGAIKDDQGYEPIHYAAGCESPAPMLFLLEKRCGMFGRTKTRMTPLMCALEAGREETTLALLKFAATPGENGGGGQEVADKLVREKGPGGKQAVHFAARHGCAKVLEYLLTECGEAAAVNAASGGASKATPLTLAAQNGHLECVRVLLANGARVDLGDKLKKTPLILAVKNGHTRVAAVLINGGANVNAYDTSENSVAHYAASYGWPSCLQLLCDVGAELWSQNAWGFVPLACALLKQRLSGEAQQKFLDFRDRQGRTMLFLQCQHSHSLGQISYLCGKGLNPNISDSDDGSVSNGTQDLAKFFLEAVGLLLQHGAHPQYELYREELIQENTSEPLAMVGNQTEIVDLLLKQNGVRPDAQSSDGSDAWMTAAALGRTRPQHENFFHVVANHNASQLAAIPKLIRHSKSDSEYSDPDDSGDDGDDDSSNDSDGDGAITSTPKPLPVPDTSTKYKSKPMIMVEYETALHLIAKRKLTSEPTNPWMQCGSAVDGKLRITQSSSNSREESPEPKVKTRSYFYHAVNNGLTGICHMLLNATFCRRQAIEDSVRCETLLHSLAKTRQTGFDNLAKKLAWALVDAGVRADIQDKKGNLALHYAAKRGNTRLLDFLHHQDGGAQTENVKNKAGESPLLFALKQKRTGSNLGDDQLLTVLCYFVEHPSHSLDILQGDDSKMNVLGAFLDRFVESLAVSKPVLFFSMLETLLKRGVDSNASFHTKGDNDKMPPLVRVAITTDASVRYHALALLLRYGAKLSIPDGRGNTLLMHLAARNLTAEMRLALGLIRSVPDPKDVFSLADSTRVCSLHVPEASVKAALAQQNAAGLTACHMAVQPLDYGSYENARLLAMLVRAGGDLRTRDASGKSVIDYARDQRSQFVLRFLERTFPDFVTIQPDTSKPKTIFASAPTYLDDANAYLAECEASGKISRSRVVAKVNASCDVGKGTELDALLTKVDVKNGRFGLNVFYRLQLVRDELQDILVLFTNWGRIGETGKFQNTPFRDEAEAVNEFKKIFRSKTGNTWESRAPGEFVKKPKKYNLVQRVNYATKVDDEVTRSFREDMDNSTSKGVVFPEPSDADLVGSPNVMAMLAAITDVRNLQLAAQTSCGFAGGDLPLAKQDELRTALEKLQEIRDLLKEKEELVKEIGTASGDLSDDGATKPLTEKVSERSSRYYEIMPCQEDSDVLASSIKAFDQVGDVNVEITRLRMLSDIMETYKMLLGAKRAQPTQNPLEYCYHALQVRLAPLQPADAERQLIHRYFFGGLRSHDRQRYRISNVFEVERRGETQRFNELMEERPDLRATQTHLLWHGTKRTNLMGILSQGLRVAPPEAPHHGYAYGKGLYFANVAEKSLNYCDAPYALPILDKDGKPDKSTTKTREVHYMLLCEVALGKPTELTATAAWGGDPLPREGMDSVKALAVHNPDPRGALVSPKCGAKLHLGQVMQLGIKLPYDLVWAKTEPNPSPIGWYERNPKFAAETQEYLAKLLADKTFAVGDTHTYQFDERTIIIELLSRETPGASLDEDDADAAEVAPQKVGSGAWCEATLKVTIRPDNDAAYSYSVKLYRNTLTSSPLADGFTLVEPVLSDYAELVVYKEAQARIRYVVEVETV
uniref:Poly [ADP-ribose] polymerase n=1 Tax=Phytophthora ramorum TaxID=164328 RepID=H3HD44_PHYRM